MAGRCCAPRSRSLPSPARASRSRRSASAARGPGLRPQHLAAVRAAALVCQAKVGGAYDGSPDLRFEPGALHVGAVPIRDRHRGSGHAGHADDRGPPGHDQRGRARGGDRRDPRPFQPVVPLPRAPLGGGGRAPGPARRDSSSCARASIRRAAARSGRTCRPGRVRPRLALERRGALVEIVGTSGAREPVKDAVTRAAAGGRGAGAAVGGAAPREPAGKSPTSPPPLPGRSCSSRPCSRRAAPPSGSWASAGVRAEILGDRAARTLLAFLDTEGAVDPHLADQLAVPLAMARRRRARHHERRHRAPGDGGGGGQRSSASGRVRGAGAADPAGSRWTRVDPPEAGG